jgi:hypothetical protein
MASKADRDFAKAKELGYDKDQVLPRKRDRPARKKSEFPMTRPLVTLCLTSHHYRQDNAGPWRQL